MHVTAVSAWPVMTADCVQVAEGPMARGIDSGCSLVLALEVLVVEGWSMCRRRAATKNSELECGQGCGQVWAGVDRRGTMKIRVH